MTDCEGFLFVKHNFGKWEIVKEGEVHEQQPFSNKSGFVGFWLKQKRTCINCGYTQIRLDKVKG